MQEFVKGVDALGERLDGREAEEAAALLQPALDGLEVDGFDALVKLDGTLAQGCAEVELDGKVDQENAEADAHDK